MQKKVKVIVVNFNSGNLLKKCIESLFANCDEQNFSICIVDNFSNDLSLNFLEDYQNIELIKNNENLGFSRACNLGASNSTNEYYLFLNPDTVFIEDSIKTSLDFMENDKQLAYGACGVKQLKLDGTVQRSCTKIPTPFSMFISSIKLNFIFRSLGYEMNYWSHEDNRDVGHVIGSFYFIRSEIFHSLKGFDQRFFVYLEDLDLSKRLNDYGMKVRYLSDTTMIHVGGGVSRKIKDRRLFFSLQSRVLFCEKHFSAMSNILINLLILPLELFLRLMANISNKEGFMEVTKGYKLFFNWYLKKRKS